MSKLLLPGRCHLRTPTGFTFVAVSRCSLLCRHQYYMLYDLGFHSSHFFVASIARKFYKHSGIGIDGLRQIYGGPKRRGAKPNKAVLGSGAVMRSAIKQLEILKVIEKDPKGYVFFCVWCRLLVGPCARFCCWTCYWIFVQWAQAFQHWAQRFGQNCFTTPPSQNLNDRTFGKIKNLPQLPF